MNPGELVTFKTAERSRETLPVLGAHVIGSAIECADQVGTMRIVSGDRVRIAEIREGFALVEHTQLKGAVCLVSLALLQPIPADLTQPLTSEDDHL
jgi:hypothetical protein